MKLSLVAVVEQFRDLKEAEEGHPPRAKTVRKCHNEPQKSPHQVRVRACWQERGQKKETPLVALKKG